MAWTVICSTCKGFFLQPSSEEWHTVPRFLFLGFTLPTVLKGEKQKNKNMEWLWIFGIIVLILICSMFVNNDDKVTQNVILSPGIIRLDDIQVEPMNKELLDELKDAIKSYKNTTDVGSSLWGKIKSVTNPSDSQILNELYSPLMLRNSYSNLQQQKDILSKYENELNLQSDEYILYRYKSAALFTVQKIFTEITYTGGRVSQGVFRAGSATINSRNVEGLKLKQNGFIYITNKRIIFIGNDNSTNVINIDKIIAIALFEENGIIFKISNSNPFVISFNGNFTYDTTSGYFDDSKLQAFTVLDCILGS